MSASDADVTRILQAAGRGDGDAAERLWAAVYDELRRIAERELRREAAGRTLSATGLVHEAYLKLVDQDGVSWQDRGHFYGVACRAMRQVLVDRARQRRAQKRGGGERDLTLRSTVAGDGDRAYDLVELDEALDSLGRHDGELARIVELHFFGGLSLREVAEVTGSSLRTAERGWARARAYLRLLLEPGLPG